MASPRDDAEFLAGSPSRFRVLEELVGAPSTLETLEAVAGVSRTTLWRILTEFERRKWIERDDDEHAVTPLGVFVAESYANFLTGLEVADKLGELIQWLPRSEIGFDLTRLATAEVAVPTPSDPQAPLRLAHRQTVSARDVKILTHAMSPAVMETAHEGVHAGEQEVEAVLTRGALDALLSDSALARQLRELIETDGGTVYRYDGDVPHVLAIFDGARVGYGVDDDQGRPQAVLDITDAAVLEWAEETFTAYRNGAERLDPGCFTE